MTLFTLLLACGNPNGLSYSGHTTYDYFGFDGERTWKYQSEDPDTAYTLVVEKTDYRFADGVETITFEYSTEDPQALLGSVTWQSSSISGTGFTGYSVGDEEMTFDTPVILATSKMVTGSTVETETNGVTFTSTMLGEEACPNNWSSEEWECLHFLLEVSDENHSYPFVGDYWMANGWGASRFNVSTGAWGSTEDWVLIGAEWSPE